MGFESGGWCAFFGVEEEHIAVDVSPIVTSSTDLSAFLKEEFFTSVNEVNPDWSGADLAAAHHRYRGGDDDAGLDWFALAAGAWHGDRHYLPSIVRLSSKLRGAFRDSVDTE